MPLVVAVSVKSVFVAEFFSSTFAPGEKVIHFNELPLPKEESTPPTFSLLFLKQFSKRCCCQWVCCEPPSPVEKVSIKRACLAFYLDVALNGC